MASSSVSQEDLENDFELSSRRSRIRSARARTSNSTRLDANPDGEDTLYDLKQSENFNVASVDHDASPKPLGRSKEKRTPRCVPIRQPLADHLNRANHLSKGKQQRDRRKLREKRRSTGVVHLQSTESTGGSTGEDDEELQLSTSFETKSNTLQNEQLADVSDRPAMGQRIFQQRRNKSPSDLDADDEDNQNQSDSTVSSLVQHRPGTPTGETVEERLDRLEAENRRLLTLLDEKDKRIVAMEKKIQQMQVEGSLDTKRLRDELATKSK